MLSGMGRLSVPDRPARERQNVPYGLCETEVPPRDGAGPGGPGRSMVQGEALDGGS